MIELRGLHLGNIARSPAESVRPDLWPDWAVAPILGCTGAAIVEIAAGRGLPLYGTYGWSAFGYRAINSSYCQYKVPWSSPNHLSFLLCGWWVESVPPFSITVGDITSPSSLCGIGSGSVKKPRAFLYTEAFNGVEAPSTYNQGIIAIASRISASSRDLWVDGNLVATDSDADTMPTGNLSISVNRLARATSNFSTGGTVSLGAVYTRWLTAAETIEISADPLLPFRRRQPVFYSVPSGGGATRNLIAALTGESATGTISAIIARALSGDVTATSITGAITASMARDLLASLHGQSTTGDIAATLQRLLLASLGAASATGDVATTTARDLLADLQASSTTPDIAATLAALVALTASISGTTITPAVAATMARALAANLAGQSTTGAIAVEFAGMLLLVASIAGTSTTGALTATTTRELRAAIDAASASGQVDGQLLRQIAATVAGASVTGTIAAELVNLVSLAASVVGASITPAVVASLQRGLAADVAAGSTTGAAAVTVARALEAAVTAGSLTPDNLVLILTGLGILHDTTIISRTPRRGITSRTVRRTIHSA